MQTDCAAHESRDKRPVSSVRRSKVPCSPVYTAGAGHRDESDSSRALEFKWSAEMVACSHLRAKIPQGWGQFTIVRRPRPIWLRANPIDLVDMFTRPRRSSPAVPGALILTEASEGPQWAATSLLLDEAKREWGPLTAILFTCRAGAHQRVPQMASC